MPAVFDYACMNMHRKMTVFMEAVPSDRITKAESDTHSQHMNSSVLHLEQTIVQSHCNMDLLTNPKMTGEELKNNKQRYCIFSSFMPVLF